MRRGIEINDLKDSIFSAKKITTNKNEISYEFNIEYEGYRDWTSGTAICSYSITVKDDYVVAFKVDITEEGEYGDYKRTENSMLTYPKRCLIFILKNNKGGIYER